MPTDVVEIACDESGSEGDKLIGGTTDVFAHASVDVPGDVAAAWLEEVRRRCRSPADEVKASVVLREQNRPVLRDLLGADGPYRPDAGGAHVQLVDKRQHLAGRLIALTGGEAHEWSAPDAGADPLLVAFNDLMRSRSLEEARGHAVTVRREGGIPGSQNPLADAARRVPTDDAGLLELLDRRRPEAVLDPLVPLLAAAVDHWAAGVRDVRVVHDEHRTLREGGLDTVRSLVATPTALVDVRFVDSRDDARVQLADFLAGAARRVASAASAGRTEDDILELLDPYVAGSGAAWPRSRLQTRDGVLP